MRKDLTQGNVIGLALALGAVVILGGYWHEKQQEINSLQQLIDKSLDGSELIAHKDRVALVKDRIVLENAIAGVLIQGAGGVFFFVTAYFSWKNLEATQEKQVTERFTQAINQLGSENIVVRVGGIYALERVAGSISPLR